MGRSPRDARRPRKDPPSDLVGQRLRVALLVATIFGLPLCLMLVYLLTRGAGLSPPFAAQPGGALEGRVVDPDGAPVAGHRVAILLYLKGSEPTPHAEAETGPDGRFTARVPALDGCYVVRAGGGPWIETAREVSLAGKGARPLQVDLRPGAELVLHLARADGSPVRGGRYYLRRREGLLGLPLPSSTATGSFTGDTLRRGGLPPGEWSLTVELADGTSAALELDLPAGTSERKLPPF